MKKGFEIHEEFIKNSFNGRKQIASGALWIAKADVRNSSHLIECKSTEKGYFILSAKVLDKIEKEAIKDSLREPLLAIRVQLEDYICYRSYSGEKKNAKVVKINKDTLKSVQDNDIIIIGDWVLTTLERYLEKEN